MRSGHFREPDCARNLLPMPSRQSVWQRRFKLHGLVRAPFCSVRSIALVSQSTWHVHRSRRASKLPPLPARSANDVQCANQHSLPFGAGTAASKAGQTVCGDCMAGTFAVQQSPKLGAVKCSPCAAGTITASSKQSFCVPCGSGRWRSCTRSQSGRAGLWSNQIGVSVCAQCDPGKFSSSNATNGATVCNDCAPGSFSGAAGQQFCRPCPPGTATASLSSKICVACAPGLSSPVFTTSNLMCRVVRRDWRCKLHAVVGVSSLFFSFLSSAVRLQPCRHEPAQAAAGRLRPVLAHVLLPARRCAVLAVRSWHRQRPGGVSMHKLPCWKSPRVWQSARLHAVQCRNVFRHEWLVELPTGSLAFPGSCRTRRVM